MPSVVAMEAPPSAAAPGVDRNQQFRCSSGPGPFVPVGEDTGGKAQQNNECHQLYRGGRSQCMHS